MPKHFRRAEYTDVAGLHDRHTLIGRGWLDVLHLFVRRFEDVVGGGFRDLLLVLGHTLSPPQDLEV